MTIPSEVRNIVRIRYAPQMATQNAAISAARMSIEGSNAIQRTAAIGSQRMIVTTFQPAKPAMSSWIGWRGRSSAAESSPSRIRHSQPYGVKTMFMFRTSVQTM